MMIRNLALALIIFCTGCSYPKFSNPIVPPKNAKQFEELFGAYQTKHPDTGEISWLHIGRQRDGLPDGFHKFVWVSPPDPKNNDQGLTAAEYLGFVFRKDDSYIIQIPCVGESGDNQASLISEKWDKLKIDDYCLVRLKRNANELRLDLLVEKNIEKLIDRKDLKGVIEQEIDESTVPPTIGRKSVVVTAESDELERFFLNTDHDDIFEPSGYIFTKQIAR